VQYRILKMFVYFQKTLQRNEQAVHEIPPPQQERYYVAMPTERYQRTWNSQHDQSTIPLHPM
jgi:hypothetical protein